MMQDTAFAEAVPRVLCTDCGVSRTAEPKRCASACQFIKPDYPAAEIRVHGRSRDASRGDELFFGPVVRMLRASLKRPSAGAQWTGITTRIAEKLLETGEVTAVLTMAPDPSDIWRPVPVLVTRAEDLAGCRGMRMGYAPLLALLEPARAAGHVRLAVIGIPCQIYALRALEEELGFERLFVIGTPCSDNTTTEHFHEFLGLITDKPETVTYLEFRTDYHVELRFSDGTTRAIPFLQLPLSKLRPDFFPLTCRTCVDYTNVLSDITVGYMGGAGEQWIVTRNARGEALLELLGDEVSLSEPTSAGKRQGAVRGFMKNTALAAGGLPVRSMPDWLRPIVGWLMPRVGPRGLEFARARVEMKAVETILHLQREHPRRMRAMVPAHVWALVRGYGLVRRSDGSLENATAALKSVAAALLLTGMLASTRVYAQAPDASPPAPDKSQYTLFDPTPDSQMRSFSPDRPDKNTGPNTVDAGHVQYEVDLFGYSHDGYTQDGTLQQMIFTADPTLKLGLTNGVDGEITINGYQIQRTKDRATETTQSAHGFGDLMLRLKVALFGNDGGDYAAAIIPYVKIPTAARALGNNQVEGGAIVPFQFPLPFGLVGLVDSEIDVLKNPDDSGQHLVTSNLVSVDYNVTKRFGVSAEFWSQNGAAHTPAQYTADFAVTYLFGTQVQLDAGTFIGLNKAAPDFVLYTGLSQRF